MPAGRGSRDRTFAGRAKAAAVGAGYSPRGQYRPVAAPASVAASAPWRDRRTRWCSFAPERDIRPRSTRADRPARPARGSAADTAAGTRSRASSCCRRTGVACSRCRNSRIDQPGIAPVNVVGSRRDRLALVGPPDGRTLARAIADDHPHAHDAPGTSAGRDSRGVASAPA